MRSLLHAGLAAGLGLALFAATAAAVDTWEPYPLGPSTLEFYATRYGSGAADDASSGYALSGGPVWGVSPRSHVYLFLGLSSSDQHRGGMDFLSFGFFSNLYDGRVLDLDAYAQLDALGPGLTSSARLVGLEYNVDFRFWGLFARTAWAWENAGLGHPVDGADAELEDDVGRRDLYTYGAYIDAGSGAQIMGELRQDSLHDFETLDNKSRLTSWALGYNRELSGSLELIMEARAHEPEGDEDRVWDFTLGIVSVW